MEIEDLKVVLGNDILGACYVTDRYGGLIGWYDIDLKVLYIDTRYKHIEKLLKHCDEFSFQIEFSNIEEPEVLKYFTERRLRMKKKYEEHQKTLRWIDENIKDVPSKRKAKAVKDAEQKIKKRHG